MPSIQIFKPGRVTSMEGVAVDFTAADLQGIASRYDPDLHEAPIVVGHPEHDAPAYGWVGGLAFADGALVAHEQQVNPEFDQLRKRGSYKKVSARFYTPAAKNNPTPGQYYLRDVGFLGAMPPAVKGLQRISFADDVGALLTAELSFGDLPAWGGSAIARMFRSVREFLIADKGQDVADRVLPDWEIESLRELSQRADDAPETQPAPEDAQASRPIDLASFADKGDADFLDVAQATPSTPGPKEPATMSKTPEQLQADLDAANAQIEALQGAERERAQAARHAEHASFADALVKDGRWPTGARDVLVASLDVLATPVESACVSFGDGEAAQPLHQALRTQLLAMPALVSFAEFAGKQAGGAVLSDRQAADRAAAYRSRMAAQGHNISLATALDAVHAGTDKE